MVWAYVVIRMVEVGTFSRNWHDFYSQNVERSDRHWLREIEDQLAQYENLWRQQGPTDFEGLNTVGVEGTSTHLKTTTRYLDFIARVTLYRSIRLMGAFIASVNREDFESSPLLLRAVMEQGALGIHAARKIREGFEAYRDRKPDGERLLHEAEVSSFFGAKINYGAYLAGIQNHAEAGDYDFDVEEWDLIKGMIEHGQLSEKTVTKEFRGFTIEMISKMLDAVDAEHLQERAPSGTYRAVWEHLSQYCHPSVFAWSFRTLDVLHGGSYSPSREDEMSLKRKALATFIQPMWEWVQYLPGQAVEKLAALESEVEREAEAPERKP